MFSKAHEEYGASRPVVIATALAWLSLLIALGACNLMPPSIPPTESVAGLEASLTVIAPNPETAPDTHPSVLTATVGTDLTPSLTEAVILPTQISQPVVVTETESAPMTGYLFVHTPLGIQQVTLTDNTFQNLLTVEDDWLDWGGSFAQNKKYLAYWVKTAQGTELWFTSLPEWQPQSLLEIKVGTYDFATLLWSVNDRYLLLNLSVLDDSGPLEDIQTIRTYILDVETMEVVYSPYWAGDCSILSPSPQTSELALWCYTLEQEENKQEFLVLEPNEDPWLTQEFPDALVDICLLYRVCAWSQDGELIAYVAQKHYPESLFYSLVNNPAPVQIDDELTKGYSFPVWSPDSQFLYYSGACVQGGDIECPNLISIPEQEVIWRANHYDNWGEKNIKVAHVAWSPDSRYIALPIFIETASGIEEQILFFDVMTQEEISRISELDSPIMDMVWVAN